jgi:hypothetical protein
MVIALFTLVALAVMVSVGTLIGGSNTRATRNYREASQSQFVAESAIAQALQTVNSTSGVRNFQTDVVQAWPTMWGSGTRTFATQGGYTYSVTAAASAGNPQNAGRFVATADGTEGTHRVIAASVIRDSVPGSAGAIYLSSNNATDATFNGDAFSVNGNDRNLNGTAGSRPPVPGIATRNDTNTNEARNSLSNQQKDDVQGLGYMAGSPPTPSIMTAGSAPSVTQMNQLINDLLALGPTYVDTVSGTQITGNKTYGTTTTPRITHFDGGGLTIGAGTVDGAGIMIVEGDLKVLGTFSFDGLILVRGTTQIGNDVTGGLTDITGNATLYGSLWSENLNLKVSGSAVVSYSSQALALANQASNYTSLPAMLKMTSLADCNQVQPGVGGCPS